MNGSFSQPDTGPGGPAPTPPEKESMKESIFIALAAAVIFLGFVVILILNGGLISQKPHGLTPDQFIERMK